MGGYVGGVIGLIFGFMFMLVLGAIFSTIGGLLGAVFFRKPLPPDDRRHADVVSNCAGARKPRNPCRGRVTSAHLSTVLRMAET